MNAITAIFEDGQSASFTCRPGEVVYQAARRAGIELSHDCLEGACGECKARCSSGDFSIDDYSDEALSARELQEGYTLLCKMVPRDDCVLELPYPASFSSSREQARREGRVSAVDRVSSTVIRTRLEVDGDPLRFLAGQYANLEVPGTGLLRAYSYANEPGSSTLEFFHKLVPDGVMSQYLANTAKVGDVITLHPPSGHFYWRPVKQPVLMVAGGTGLAPMLSMLRSLPVGSADVLPIHLIYGVNDSLEFFAKEELEALAQELPLSVHRISVSGDAWNGPVGFVSDLIESHFLGKETLAYLCGPPPMVEASTEKLMRLGVESHAVHAERFLACVAQS